MDQQIDIQEYDDILDEFVDLFVTESNDGDKAVTDASVRAELGEVRERVRTEAGKRGLDTDTTKMLAQEVGEILALRRAWETGAHLPRRQHARKLKRSPP